MLKQRLMKYLDRNKVKYTVINHSTAYTAQETAEVAHVSGKELAKVIVVKIKGKLAMVVLPAFTRIEMFLLKEATGSEDVELATEKEFKKRFSDCEIGAMPPFGNLYHMPVFVAKRLTEDEEIAFNAGNHRVLIKMKFSDFRRLVKPEIVDFAFEVTVGSE